MFPLAIKPGVDLTKLTPRMALCAVVAAGVFNRHGLACRITSCGEGKHSEKSLHYVGDALDLGAPPRQLAQVIVEELREALGGVAASNGSGQFDVVAELDAPGGPHLHLEFDP